MSENLRQILLQTARGDFPTFYARANADEAKFMDMLVLLTALFVRLKKAEIGDDHKSQVRDEECMATRQMCAKLREHVESGRAFTALPTLEQEKIQRVIFRRVS